ncbi:hypothetical protein V2J09_005130 [Rumex salicifolius]
MYSDRVEEVGNLSVKDRLNGGIVGDDSVRRRSITGKRQRQDDKWEHDLFDDESRLSRSKVSNLDARDLRLKLQKRGTEQGPRSGGVRDLREKLSGSMNLQPLNADPPKPKLVAETSKPIRRSVISEAPALQARRISSAIVKKTQRKADASVEGFLRSLGLEKYQIQFQAEEVDMAALEHMTDEDLKVMGIPMGPRKKILSALPSRT